MYKIKSFKNIAKGIWRMAVEAPHVANYALPGQFIVLRTDVKGERIPLTINEIDKSSGTVRIIFQEVGVTTKKLARMKAGDSLVDFVGPLGRPAEIKNFGRVVCVAGGVGAAEIYPEAVALKDAGCHITTILGARSKDFLILEKEFRVTSDELYVTTDDGSYGRKGVVTEPLKELLEGSTYNLVLAVGPVIMMKFVCQLTAGYGTKTVVNLNPIMVDGTGMCGSCRVMVGDETKFVCVDGPEFDGHKVDFAELELRNSRFKEEEASALKKFKKGQRHKGCQRRK